MKDHYDTIGQTYLATRRSDPRVAAAIERALGASASVANIGAGTGSYEPPQTVVAVEPSRVMIDQRLTGSAPVVQAGAERLPLRDNCVETAMALMTVHHWSDLTAGLAEMRRIATDRLVVFTWNPEITMHCWLLAEYFPEAGEIDHGYAVPVDVLTRQLPNAAVDPILIPHDCLDGFAMAYWRPAGARTCAAGG
jgi:hypothetical protein